MTFFDSFKIHDQEGVPLSVQWDMARASGHDINLAAFACDALHAGWTEDKIRKVICEAAPHVEWIVFMRKLKDLWMVAEVKPDPYCWQAMKKFIVDTQNRICTSPS